MRAWEQTHAPGGESCPPPSQAPDYFDLRFDLRAPTHISIAIAFKAIVL